MLNQERTDTGASLEDIDADLDNALELTFPASDPIAIGHPTSNHPRRPVHRQTPVIVLEVASQPGRDKPSKPGDEAPPGTPGTGEDLCPKCGGTGRSNGEPCPNCAGTGKITEGIGGA